MRQSLPAALGTLAFLAVAGIASAAPATLVIDRSHSEVGFGIRHFFNKVHGEFSDFSGAISFDPENVANSTVEVTIRDTSIFTGNERRDGHLRGDEFFWTEKYPHITFKSTKVTPTQNPKKFQVAGNLTIRDVTKPVVLETELLGIGDVPAGPNGTAKRAGFLAKTTINRKDFGIVWNRALDQGAVMLGDDVDITLDISAVSKPPAAGAAASKAATDKAPASTNKK
jgi:polyisoprenoid-binding protein YceI